MYGPLTSAVWGICIGKREFVYCFNCSVVVEVGVNHAMFKFIIVTIRITPFKICIVVGMFFLKFS